MGWDFELVVFSEPLIIIWGFLPLLECLNDLIYGLLKSQLYEYPVLRKRKDAEISPWRVLTRMPSIKGDRAVENIQGFVFWEMRPKRVILIKPRQMQRGGLACQVGWNAHSSVVFVLKNIMQPAIKQFIFFWHHRQEGGKFWSLGVSTPRHFLCIIF